MIVIGVTLLISLGILWMSSFHPILRLIVGGIMVYFCIAPRGLCQEAKKVVKRLQNRDLVGARRQLSMIVGRDTAELSKTEILRAVIETVAENFSDGVAAPLFYIALGGPAFGMVYKAVNTLDSLFGYRNDKYRDFGFIPALMDDLFNLIPARLSALLVILASFLTGLDGRNAARIWIRDRYKHLSPNSAHPESAFSGALGIAMGGAHHYGGVLVEKPTIGEEKLTPDFAVVKRSFRLLTAATLLCVLLCCGVSAIIYPIW